MFSDKAKRIEERIAGSLGIFLSFYIIQCRRRSREVDHSVYLRKLRSCTWSEEVNQFLVFQATTNKLLSADFAVPVDVHPLKDALCPGLGGLELVHGYLVRAHHVVD
jgi:hypothetical protein